MRLYCAFSAKQQPAYVQLYFEVGTASMMAAKGAIFLCHQLSVNPVNRLMKVYLSAVHRLLATSSEGKNVVHAIHIQRLFCYYTRFV